MLFLATPSWPCSVACVPFGLLSPVDGATDVPLNVQIRFTSALTNVELLRGDAGVAVDRIQEGGVVALVPRELLAPLTTYSIQRLGSDFVLSTTFTTGMAIDSTPPTLGAPTLQAFRSPAIDLTTCGDIRSEFYSLTYGASDDRTAPGQLIHLGFLGSTVDDIALDVPALGTAGALVIQSNSACPQSTLPDLMRRPQLAALAVVVDLAGNRSAPSQAVQVKGCGGCSGAGGSLAVVSAILVPLRRRRRTC